MTLGDIKKLCFKELCWAKACENLHWGQAGEASLARLGSGQVCSPGGLAVSPGQPCTCFVSKSLLSFTVGDLPVLWLMVSPFRRVLPDLYEMALEDTGEL